MRTLVASFLLVVAIVLPVCGQSFSNLDFESTTVVEHDPNFGFLDWDRAVPGWGHSSGSDTSYVYYHSPHFGISQWYLLVDPQSQPQWLLAGTYSIAFKSGNSDSRDSMSPWVLAYLSQTGGIPLDAQSIQLLATGPFAVFVGGNAIAMQPLGGNAYAGNISSFAGTITEVKIVNTSLSHQVVVVDNISFSSTAVPEPVSIALVGIGLLLCLVLHSRGRVPTAR